MDLDDCILLEDNNDCFIVNPKAASENIKSNKELAEVKNSQGSTFYSKQQFLLARNLYSEAIELDPNNAVFFANRAAANMSLNEMSSVLDDLEKAIALNSGYLKAYTRKFNYLLSIGDLFKAEQTIENIKLLDKDNKQIEQMAAKVASVKYNGNLYDKAVSKEDYREALFYIEHMLQSCHSSLNLKLKKAEALAFLRRHEEVLGVVDSILRKESTNSEAYFTRGLSLYYQDNLEKAIAHFEQALKFEPEHKKSAIFIKKAKQIKNIKEQGKNAMMKNEMDKAIEYYREALKIDTSHVLCNAKLHFNLSVVYGKKNQIKEALNECNNAIKLDSNYDKAYMKRAGLYDNLEMYEECVRDYELLYKKLKTRETKDHLEKAKLMLQRSKRKNYYKILGIAKTANETEIKRAYRKRALETHPDRHSNLSEEERLNQEKKFKDVNEAYSCLSDAQKKQRYDNGLDVNDGSSSANFHDSFRMFCDDDILNNMFFNFKR